ncbi:MAG: DNA replication complex GINS family protein [Methanospirillaceae archaeon]|nr:DNA replication complex GINS family protein [Methanospirillaceae archaeon]
MMHLEDLRKILLSERESGKLVSIPQNTYISVQEEIRAIQKEVYAKEDPFSEESRILIEREASIRETSEEIFSLRSGKIVAIAQSAATGAYIRKSDLMYLLPPEREMFDKISAAIRDARNWLLKKDTKTYSVSPPGDSSSSPITGIQSPEMPDVIPVPVPVNAGDDGSEDLPDRELYPVQVVGEEDQEEEDTIHKYALVRVLKDVERFTGVDTFPYDIFAGDIITLPARNAEILQDLKVVLNINRG